MLSVAVGLMGFVYSERLNRRKRYLDALYMFSSQCVGQMRCKSDNIFEIFKENGKKELAFLRLVTPENIADVAALQQILLKSGFLEQDIFLISEFVSRLGMGDIGAQSEYCSFYSEKFSYKLKEARDEARDKGRLFKSLFMFAGAALFIIFI